ncbi:hypothetical protein CDEST_07536 [Colletotrichum destructivum]|uniref:Uncharacterized protein n=1 Tax=Colletotrichum destructivum TaxID=34406 RepID=A0AAX4IGU0_9PEZI|nr:hypothetical protein CDEST_07536 [Colletotrichum destructivum]
MRAWPIVSALFDDDDAALANNGGRLCRSEATGEPTNRSMQYPGSDMTGIAGRSEACVGTRGGVVDASRTAAVDDEGIVRGCDVDVVERDDLAPFQTRDLGPAASCWLLGSGRCPGRGPSNRQSLGGRGSVWGSPERACVLSGGERRVSSSMGEQRRSSSEMMMHKTLNDGDGNTPCVGDNAVVQLGRGQGNQLIEQANMPRRQPYTKAKARKMAARNAPRETAKDGSWRRDVTPRSRPLKGPRAPRRLSPMSTTHPPRHSSIGVIVDGSRTANGGQRQSSISRMANQPNGTGSGTLRNRGAPSIGNLAKRWFPATAEISWPRGILSALWSRGTKEKKPGPDRPAKWDVADFGQ